MDNEIPGWAIGQAMNMAQAELLALKIFSGRFVEIKELSFKENKEYWRKLKFLQDKYLQFILKGRVDIQAPKTSQGGFKSRKEAKEQHQLDNVDPLPTEEI